jgi:hypothetical protein
MPAAKKTAEKEVKKSSFFDKMKSKLPKKDSKEKINRAPLFGKIGFIIGLVGVFSFALQLYVPLLIIFNVILAIVGLVISILGLKAEKIGFSAAGITMCIILLTITLMAGLYNLIVTILQSVIGGA